MTHFSYGVLSAALTILYSLVAGTLMCEQAIHPGDPTSVKPAVTRPDRHGANPSSRIAKVTRAAEATKASVSSRSYLSTVKVFDNGDTDFGCCREITAHTLAEDFVLSSSGTVSGASFVLNAGSGDFPALWDGSLEWWIYADAGGEPGSVIASGTAENVVWGLDQCCDYYDVFFDLGANVTLDGETVYWFGIHMAADWSGEVGFYWSFTDPGTFSTAFTATSATGPWSGTTDHLAFTLHGTTTPTNSGCLDVAYSWKYGGTPVVVVSGNYAYFANGTYLQVADISTITNPQVVGEVDLNSEFWGADISGDHLLVPTLDGELLILDISNPAAPSVATAIRLVGSGFEILAEGNLAYLSGGRGMSIFDITSVTAPVQIGFYPTEDSVYAVSIEGATAYIAAFEDGLHVVDVTDPTAPSRLGHLPIAGYQEYVASVAGYAFLADGADAAGDWTGQLRVINVSVPSAPTQVASIGGYSWLEAITMWGDYVIVSASDDGLHIIDVSTPTTPTDVGDVEIGGLLTYAATTATHALAADWAGSVHLIELDPVAGPAEVATIDTAGPSTGLGFLDDHTLVAAGIGRLTVYDVTNPAAPSVTATLDVSGTNFVEDVEVMGDLAFLTSPFDQISVIDLSDPENPIELGSVPVDTIMRIDVSGDYIYGAAYNRLEVVDITNPATPELYGDGYDMAARDVGVIGETAFVASRTDGLQCMDITSPAAPTEIGGLVNDIDAFVIGIWDDKVAVGGQLISTGAGAWMIADVQSPSSPSPQVTHSSPGGLYSIKAADNLLFPAGYYRWLEVHDVTNPRMPIHLASNFDLVMGNGEPEAAFGLLAISAGRTSGFHLVDYSACANTVIFVDNFETGDTTIWSN